MTVSVPTLWLIAAVVLGLSELLVGTFYLLLLGVAALVGALAAFAGFALEIQCLIAAAVVLVGGVIIARYRDHHKKDARSAANGLGRRAPRKISCGVKPGTQFHHSLCRPCSLQAQS